MRSFRNSFADAEAGLGHHLGRLHDDLANLSSQLREAVAQAIGQSAADAARQSVLSLLGQVSNVASFRRSKPLWQNLDDADDRDEQVWPRRPRPWQEPEDEYEDERYGGLSRRPDEAARPRPWRQARVAALLALAWWSRYQIARRPLPATVGFALAGGLALYLSRRAIGPAPGLVVTLLSDAIGAAVTGMRGARR